MSEARSDAGDETPEFGCEVRFVNRTRRIIAIIAFVLVLVTWRLWFPLTDFPQVPLVAFAGQMPVWIVYLLSATWLIALAGMCVVNDRRRAKGGVICAGVVVLLLIGNNQHRLQPWAYHFLLSAWAVATLDGRRLLFWLRTLMLSIYLFSALSKLDLRFAETTGSLFVSVVLRWFTDTPIDSDVVTKVALLLPIGELIVAGLLFFPATRRWGICAAIALHAALILILGPLGLKQRPGVLAWNVGCAVQVVWLFRRHAFETPKSTKAETQSSGTKYAFLSIATIPLLTAVLLPLLEPWGRCDSWLAWGLYSTRAPRTELYLAADTVEHLPADLQPFCRIVGNDGIWVRVAKTNWSLASLHAPLYPHERFDLAVDLAIISRLPAGQRWFRIERLGVPDRRTGERAVEMISDETVLRQVVQSDFFWNAWPHNVDRKSYASFNSRGD